MAGAGTQGEGLGGDVDNTTLLRLAGLGELADLIWEAPAEFTAEHARRGAAAILARQSGRLREGERLWEQFVARWWHAWSGNYQALELMQEVA